MAHAPVSDFRGKVVMARIGTVASGYTSEAGWWVLEDPRLEERSGRVVLVGRAIEEHGAEPRWFEGASVHIPWESVRYCVVFDSAEAYRGAASRYRGTFAGRTRAWSKRHRPAIVAACTGFVGLACLGAALTVLGARLSRRDSEIARLRSQVRALESVRAGREPAAPQPTAPGIRPPSGP